MIFSHDVKLSITRHSSYDFISYMIVTCFSFHWSIPMIANTRFNRQLEPKSIYINLHTFDSKWNSIFLHFSMIRVLIVQQCSSVALIDRFYISLYRLCSFFSHSCFSFDSIDMACIGFQWFPTITIMNFVILITSCIDLMSAPLISLHKFLSPLSLKWFLDTISNDLRIHYCMKSTQGLRRIYNVDSRWRLDQPEGFSTNWLPS